MPITDKFDPYELNTIAPVVSAVPVVPDDVADLTTVTRALYVGQAGDVRVTVLGGDVVTFVDMVAGWHPVRVTRVWDTGTTADHLVACW